MTSYIYLSSDKQLSVSDISDEDPKIKQMRVYFSPASIESFLFKNNIDAKTNKYFSYSKHFSEGKHQVVSLNSDLPKRNTQLLSQRNKRALHELFNYICNHFENSQATYVEILFCLKGFENRRLKQRELISIQNLTVNDLYYVERKILRIDSKEIDFICQRNTA